MIVTCEDAYDILGRVVCHKTITSSLGAFTCNILGSQFGRTLERRVGSNGDQSAIVVRGGSRLQVRSVTRSRDPRNLYLSRAVECVRF